MKIFDCFMFYDEDLVIDLRLNILNEHIDEFVIVESKFTHSGKKRELLLRFSELSEEVAKNPENPKLLTRLGNICEKMDNERKTFGEWKEEFNNNSPQQSAELIAKFMLRIFHQKSRRTYQLFNR